MKNRIYTISTAHLDTSWLWSQNETAEIYLPRTMKYNFDYFKQYPEYRFNFEGVYRYELIEEYHYDDFQKLTEYVKEGKWVPIGSCYENGDTNIPSPEALIRNVLYGNSYYKEKFNKKSNDIFLPDCFGFGRALPQVMTHCGLIGFSTQKLSWGCSIEPPFEIGKWKALDDSFVYCSIKAGNYSTVLKEVRCKWSDDKLQDNITNGNIPFTMTYYGTGDRGGAPKEEAMETVFKEMKDNKTNNTEVLSGSMVDFFNDLQKLDKKQGNLREFDKEFLMITHGCGSYTSRTASKRLNKKCENYLDMAERINVLSSLYNVKKYPQDQFNFAWKKVLEHHFHDDITGTSFMECYKKNWNDYFTSINTAKSEFISSAAALENSFDTSKLENPILVYNPNQDTTSKVIVIKIDLPYSDIVVLDLEKNKYEALYENGFVKFNATIPGNTMKIFDVIKGSNATKSKITRTTSIDLKSIENKRYKVMLDDDFNIASIYDKKLKTELLESPIKYDLMYDIDSIQWPAWEIKYSDIIREPYNYFKNGTAKIIEDNPLKVAIEIVRKHHKSVLKEIITLEKDSNRIDVYNELDWQEDATDLKVVFPLKVNANHGTYDIGIAKYNRPNNTEKLYEVPCQKFARIEDNKYGVSILTDSRQGFDKPNDNTIRLTAVHSPYSNYRYECSQHLLDFGKNIFSYSLVATTNKEETSINEAEKFTKPVVAFKMNKHEGSIKNDLTLFTINNDNARVMCFKRAINEDKYILRVVDYHGNGLKNVKVNFIKEIKSLYQVQGDEEIISKVNFANNEFEFDLNKHEIKSFMIEFKQVKAKEDCEFVTLPFDKVGITSNSNRDSSMLKHHISLPKELIKNEIINSNGIDYKLKLDGNNALEFNNQLIKLNKKYKYAYLLILNQGKDKEIKINNKNVFVQNSFEKLGQYDLYGLKEFGYTKKIPQAFFFTHYHKNSKDQVLKDCYLYSVKVRTEDDTLLLNKNNNIVLFAITLSNFDNELECNFEFNDVMERRKFNYKFNKFEAKFMREPFNERIKDIFIDRRKTKYVNWWGGHCFQSPSDFYQIETEKKNYKRREKLDIKSLNK